jgi:hypothetical protein
MRLVQQCYAIEEASACNREFSSAHAAVELKINRTGNVVYSLGRDSNCPPARITSNTKD